MLGLLMFLLPLIEIAGFVVIGGEIGLGASLLWVIGAVFAGFYFLSTMGRRVLQKAQQSVAADVYPFEEMFDGFCILIGAGLLIFPGFFSDFLALPLLVPPLRRLLFLLLKSMHTSFLDDFKQNTQGFTAWYYSENDDKTIEGDYKTIQDDDKRLP